MRTPLPPTVQAIIAAMANKHDVAVADLMDTSNHRFRKVSAARHEAWRLISEEGYSGPQIAAFFGGASTNGIYKVLRRRAA